MTNLLKAFFVLVLLHLFVMVHAQKAVVGDSDIVKAYAKPVLKESQNSISHYKLIKIASLANAQFKKLYRKQILRQLSGNWFVVSDSAATIDAAIVETVLPANNLWKFSAQLIAVKKKLPLTNKYNFLVEFDGDVAGLKDQFAMQNAGFITQNYQQHFLQIETNLSAVMKLLVNDSHVKFIDIKLIQPKEEMVINGYDNSVNAINLFFAKYPKINGEGLSVSVKENLLDTADIDFKNRYQKSTVAPTEITTHATTMATLICGGGNSFFTGKGIAWGCQISSSNFSNLLPDADAVFQQLGTSVQNHSYGTAIENFYGSDAGAYDQSALTNPTLLHIFSAGNSGTLSAESGDYAGVAGFANITGSFKQAKNIITVGSVDSFYHVPAASSKGPAYDGRIKPELTAYGNDGSSGAAAITSGTALVVQSAYKTLHNGALPNSALVKAILINSADDIENAGPDYVSGYGNVNTYQAVKTITAGNYFMSDASQNSDITFTLNIPANTKTIKATLVWNDAPAAANAFNALVNDLDFALTQTASNTTWLPWVLDSTPDSAKLAAPAHRSRDSLNVAEQISVVNPTAGNYVLHVKGTDVIAASQPFFIAWQVDSAQTFEFITPAYKDHVEAGGKGIFRWLSNYALNTTGTLEYNILGSDNWTLVTDTIHLNNKYYNWQAPDTFALALARMRIGNEVVLSDTFNFSKPLTTIVDLNCSNSVLLHWNKAPGMGQYQLLQLGTPYLQPVATTVDTSINIAKSQSPFVAVTPVFSNGFTGVNSYTLNYNNQGSGCYINNFLADLNADNNAAELNLFLGTVLHVKAIQFQRLAVENNWITITEISPVTTTTLQYNHDSLHIGLNTYRALVLLDNGSIITSDAASVYYFKEQPFLVMPTLLRQGQNLHIISGNVYSGVLAIYDAAGRKINTQIVSETGNTIITSQLAKGMYFFVFYSDDKKVMKSKILVQ